MMTGLRIDRLDDEDLSRSLDRLSLRSQSSLGGRGAREKADYS